MIKLPECQQIQQKSVNYCGKVFVSYFFCFFVVFMNLSKIILIEN